MSDGWREMYAHERNKVMQLLGENQRLRKELEEIRDWALVERAPLRKQEIESINSALKRVMTRADYDAAPEDGTRYDVLGE